MQDAASGTLPGGRIALLGGLDAQDTSLDTIAILSGGRVTRSFTLPNAQHDAQAAVLGRYVYVFGGGQFATYDHILRFDPVSGNVSQSGRLPVAASDVAVASEGRTAYIVGGYDGTHWLDTVLSWHPHAAPRVLAHLPFGLRYAAAAVSDGRLIVAGGTTPGGLSDEVLACDLRTGDVSRLGRLPHPLTHASAAVLDGRVLVFGGRRQLDGHQSAAVLAIDPATGSVRRIGSLPYPVSDAAAAATTEGVLLIGGQRGASPVASVLRIVPDPA